MVFVITNIISSIGLKCHNLARWKFAPPHNYGIYLGALQAQ